MMRVSRHCPAVSHSIALQRGVGEIKGVLKISHNSGSTRDTRMGGCPTIVAAEIGTVSSGTIAVNEG